MRIDHGDIIRSSSNERNTMKRTILQKVQYLVQERESIGRIVSGIRRRRIDDFGGHSGLLEQCHKQHRLVGVRPLPVDQGTLRSPQQSRRGNELHVVAHEPEALAPVMVKPPAPIRGCGRRSAPAEAAANWNRCETSGAAAGDGQCHPPSAASADRTRSPIRQRRECRAQRMQPTRRPQKLRTPPNQRLSPLLSQHVLR